MEASISIFYLLDMLEYSGCKVDVASNGREALKLAQSHSYELILMDVQMPVMDGLAAAHELRQLPAYKQVPIIALTANAFAEDRLRCIAAGMNDHVGKPVTMDTLVATLLKWLPHSSGQAQSPVGMQSSDLGLALELIPGLDRNCAFRRSNVTSGDYYSLLCNFIDMHHADMAQLKQHLQNGDAEEARALVHKLNGISSMVGAFRVASQANLLMQQLRFGAEPGVMEAQMVSCAIELNALSVALHNLPDSLHLDKFEQKML